MGKWNVLFISLVAMILLVSGSLATAGSKLIRVAILRDADHFTLGVDGRYTIQDPHSGEKIGMGTRLRPVVVVLEKGQIKIGEKSYAEERVMIEPRQEVPVRVNNRHFRGAILIIKTSNNKLTVVNSIELEQYIKGVLYHEISDKWPMDAMMAQAVATRTYALYSINTYAARDYDVTNDVYSQVYGGKTSERYRTNLAVKRTKGEALTYMGKIFPAFFHANCGGITEDASELWKIDMAPLKGGIDSPYSVNSPHFRWHKNMRLKDIQDKLVEKGHKIGLIKEIKVLEVNKSKRVRKLQITSRDGGSLTIDGKTFREIIGPNVLRSNKYEVVMKGWYVDFNGHGWGHGVGLDQWGAYNMALMRKSYKEILQFYYPTSKITQYKDID